MKKIITIISMVVFVFSAAIAQEASTSTSVNEKFVSKKGIYILPEAGEFSLGIDAYPILSYLGNMMSDNGSDAPSFDYGNGYTGWQAIYGKYMLDNSTAVRVRLGINHSKNTTLYPVVESSLSPDPYAYKYVNDEVASIDKQYILSVGLEKMRGKSRIQGKYGAEVFVNFSKYETSIQYGNPINANFNAPVINSDYSYTGNGMRLIEDNLYQTINLGARAFVGVECFVLPKLSIGGEFGYSLGFGKGGVHEQIYEYWDAATTSVKTNVTKSSYDGYKFIGVDTDNLNGSINIFFYF